MIHVDPELKEHIIQQHLRDGRTITSLSDEYGYSRDVISRWGKVFRKAALEDIQKKQALDAMEEANRLRREIDELRKENDFLKKAAAFFAKESK